MQRKVLITITYNEMGIIIDTKAEEVAQPNSIPPVNPQELKTRWIPVSERLPEERGYYLTTTMYHAVCFDYWGGECFDRTEEIIAWMPLPAPYEPQESEEANDKKKM